MADPRTDFEGLRHAVESQVVPPPFDALRTRHRRRRRRRHGVAGVAGIAALAAAAVYAGSLRPAPDADDDLAGRLVAAGVPAPRADFAFTVTDVEFVTPQVGWALGQACRARRCEVAVRATRDGGATWLPAVTVATGVPQDGLDRQDPAAGARSLRFVDATTGYAFNPSRYVTRDGGRTWLLDPPGGKLANVQGGGVTPWFLSRPCAGGERCTWTLSGSPTDPGVSGTEAQLRRRTDAAAWLLAWDAGADSAPAEFRRTADGGRTWAAVTDPCPGAASRQLSARDDRVAWLVCAVDADPATPKRVVRTVDGGATWLPAGEIALRGVASDLHALGADTAYLATIDRAHLVVTRDGGRTWTPAEGARSSYGFSNLQFVDATHGFVMGDRGELWRTRDGRRWERLGLPTG